MPQKRPLFLLLDANALLHRAWHALPPLKSPDGTVVNAAYGVTSVVLKLLAQEKPDAMVACWDTAAPTFRHEAYEEYKGTREEKEDELYEQIPITEDVLRTLGIESVSKDGYEADDLIATFARKGVEAGYHVRIVTGDRDTLQLVSPHIDVLTFKKGVSETRIFDEKEVLADYGVRPDQLAYWKAIKGDPSDNIPGIPGIGDKGATELLQKFHDLEGAIKAAKDEKSDIKAGMRKKILEGIEDAREAYKLVILEQNVPVKKIPADFHIELDREAFIDLAAEYGFRSLIQRLPGEKTQSIQKETKLQKAKPLFMTSDDIQSFLETAQNEKLIAVVAVAGEQGSLFGTEVQGLVIGTKKKSVRITTAQLEQPKVSSLLQDLLLSESIQKICHDAKQQMALLEELDLELRGIGHDTLIAAYLLAAGERQFSFESLSLQYLGKELPEGEARPLMTAESLFAIASEQQKEMKKTHADQVMERFELPLIPILRDMERNGIEIDSAYLSKLSKEMQSEKAKLEKRMEKIAGHAFNPASPSQLAVLLFDELKLPTKGIKRGKTGYSTAASELEKLKGEHEIINLIYQHRELAKLLSTYVDVLPKLADQHGRVHTTFNQSITATGRLSSSDPNLQNIPIRTELGRSIRAAFIAGPGMELVACDYSQIELRIVAAISKDKKMLDAFKSGDDIHTATAANIWGIAKDKVTKDQRRAAKAINFGIIYGQGPVGLSQTAGITFAEAKEFIQRYFMTYKGIKNYLDETKALAHELGYVETMFGRRRALPDIHSGIQALQAQAERMAINMPVQGAAADLMKLAMIDVAKKLPKLSANSRMLLQVHDELVLEVPKKEVKAVAEFIKETMEGVEKIGCPIVAEAKYGKNWNEMKTI